MRRLLLLLLLVVVPATPTPARGAVPVVVIDGRGHGHGVGMAQDGAYWMGRDGATTPQILGHFYPGTELAKASGEVRVVVLPPVVGNEALIAFPAGGEVRDARSGGQAPGFPVRVRPGDRVRIRFDGARYTVEPVPTVVLRSISLAAAQVPDPTTTTTSSTTSSSTTTTSTTGTTTTVSSTTTTSSSTTAPPPTSTTTATGPTESLPSSTRPLWAVPAGNGTLAVPARGRQYRGLLEATATGSPLRLVNHLDVETYLRGMGEVRDPRWPPAALRAQAVAARTYGLRAMSRGGELCDTQRCQVYLGTAAEYGAMDKAVADTRGQVLAYGRALVSAVYSANGGGVSATREEGGFGAPDTDPSYPYLRSAPYLTKDPGPWSVQVALTDVAARLGYRGTVTDVRVERSGPSGRALDVVLNGSAGPQAVSGLELDRALGLRSTLFTLRVGTADSAPPPPEATGFLQELPDVVAAPLAPSPAAADVPAIPDLSEAAPFRPYNRDQRGDSLPVLPLAGAVLTLLGALVLGTGWGIARRAGLSAQVLRF